MHLSKTRGVRLLVTILFLAALAGGIIFPVSGAPEGAKGAATVSTDSTEPAKTTPTATPPVTTKATSPVTTKAPTLVTTRPTTAVTTKKATPAATRTTAQVTTRASTPTTRPSTAPTTPRTSAPTTTAPPTTVPSTAPTTQPTTVAQAPAAAALPPPVAVVTAPPVVAGSFTVPPGTGLFTVTSVGNVPVGGDGVVQLIVDNGWEPLFADTYVDLSWDPSMLEYRSSAIKVLNTTAAVSSDHSVRVMLGDFRRGYPQGRYPLAAITLRALREGTSTLTVSVDHVRYWSNDFTEFTDITATATARNGIFSTGPLPTETQPLVTFTQNTLAPVSYPADNGPDVATTTATTIEATTARTASPTAPPTVATTQPATAITTELPPTESTQTPGATGTFVPVSTRIEGSGIPPAGAIAAVVAALGAATLLARRRE